MPDLNIELTAQAVLNQLRRAGVSTGTGLTGYDLQAGAKSLFPVETPLRNRLPRIQGAGGVATNFKAITQINSNNLTPGVGEGHRNAANSTQIATRSIPYASIGHDDYVTYEAQDAAVGWENLPPRVKQNLLWALMIDEEATLLWGNGNAIATQTGSISSALGQGAFAAGSPSAATTGGSLAAATYTLYVMPLTYEGLKLAGGYFSSQPGNYAGPQLSSTRNNMGGTTDTIPGGCGKISAAATQTTTGSTSTITASATPIAAAAGYAWFIGTSTGNAAIAAITALPTFTFVSATVGSVLASAFVSANADNSVNTLEYTGLIPYIAGSPLSYVANGGGVGLASDGGRNVSQILSAFLWYWNNYRTTPDTVWCSANKAQQIDLLITKNASGQNNVVTMISGDKQGADMSYSPIGRVRMIPNPYVNKNVDIQVHPNLNDSTILFTKDSVPFPASGITNAYEYHYQRDYYGEDWPKTNRQYEYGAYTRGALALNAEMLFGLIYNLA